MYDTMNDIEFQEWPKMPRFFDSDFIISEKIDGTNSQIFIDSSLSMIRAGSRNRWLKLDDDNFGFANWVNDNQEELMQLLGPGTHYGEWWGQGIQRRYGMDRKVFSLFNSTRWNGLFNAAPGKMICDVVPSKKFNLSQICREADSNEVSMFNRMISDAWFHFMPKSLAAAKYGQDFTNPEGFTMFHERSRQVFKVPVNK